MDSSPSRLTRPWRGRPGRRWGTAGRTPPRARSRPRPLVVEAGGGGAAGGGRRVIRGERWLEIDLQMGTHACSCARRHIHTQACALRRRQARTPARTSGFAAFFLLGRNWSSLGLRRPFTTSMGGGLWGGANRMLVDGFREPPMRLTTLWSPPPGINPSPEPSNPTRDPPRPTLLTACWRPR
jgi:hypothetical protein